MIAAVLSAADNPDAADRQRMLDRIQLYASQYLENLPNFICARVTEQYESGKKPEHWKQRDTLTAKLVFNQGREEQTLELVNGKEVSRGRYIPRALETEGEFGILMSNVLDGNTGAQISWGGWDELGGKRLAMFEYLVEFKHSTLSLGLGGVDRQIVPYRGRIYADPSTGEIWRITNAPFDIPGSVLTKSITTTIDYQPVTIGTRRFILPATASVLLDTGHNNILNKVDFRDYRRFEAESKITFVSGSN